MNSSTTTSTFSQQVSFPLRGLTPLAEFAPINVGNVLKDLEKDNKQTCTHSKKQSHSSKQRNDNIVGSTSPWHFLSMKCSLLNSTEI
jgi:hypothetical protein